MSVSVEKLGQRIVIIGTTGSGKSTLATSLSHCLNLPHIELDGLYWKENWEACEDTEFEQKIKEAMQQVGDSWILDGNYSRSRLLLWSQAQTVIWLDYPLWLIYWRLTSRTLKRVFLRQKLWNNNRERFWEQFFSKSSIFLWAKTTYQRRKMTYQQIMSNKEYPHLRFIHFTHPKQAAKFLKQVQKA